MFGCIFLYCLKVEKKMSGFQLNAQIARKVDLAVIPALFIGPVLKRNYFALVELFKTNLYLTNQVIFFYYQTLQTNARFLNNNKSSSSVRVPWDSVHQESTGKPLILTSEQQYQLYMWVVVNNTQNMNTQSNFQFLIFSIGKYMTQLRTAQRTINQKENACCYFNLGNNVKNNQQMKNFLKKWVNIPTSPDSNPGPTPTPSAPSAPTISSITPANNGLIVNFTAPTDDGGEPITDYEYSTDGGLTWTSLGTTTSPFNILGLTNGTSYSVLLRAINSIGDGDASSPVSATPNGTLTINSFTTIGSTTWTAPVFTNSVEYLVVGGGGGSGATHDGGSAGGGGGGMVITGTLSVIPGNTYNIVVGDGGAGGIGLPSPSTRETDGSPGNNSVFDSIVALGGGEGYRSRFNGSGTGGASVTDPSTASIGGYGGTFNNGGGGGGGDSGAGSNGVTGVPRTGGAGGLGTSSNISGVSVTYGEGGSGGNAQVVDNAIAGTANTGNGASGPGTPFGSQRNGAKGGSGIVILKYYQ